MKRTFFAAAALSLALASGAAFAQSNEQTAEQANSNAGMMGPFYTDDTMTTPRPAEEIRTIFGEMAPADQDSLREQCQTAVDRDAPENTAETMPAGFPEICETVVTL